MNTSRHSRSLVRSTRRFLLSIPTNALSDTVLAIGSCSGAAVGDKFDHLGITPLPLPGALIQQPAADQPNAAKRRRVHSKGHEDAWAGVPAVGIPGCAAYILCSVDSETEVDGHAVMVCRMDAAIADVRYWNGKQFIQQGDLPPLLAFLGTKRFAHMVACPE
ncbi:hypothetical protein BC831DRAFT_452012 [Entophlyctis helioformis]|nr:hypothetical protein BC831DRAFT_452012 [Entophlyctis helioformis]